MRVVGPVAAVVAEAIAGSGCRCAALEIWAVHSVVRRFVVYSTAVVEQDVVLVARKQGAAVYLLVPTARQWFAVAVESEGKGLLTAQQCLVRQDGVSMWRREAWLS